VDGPIQSAPNTITNQITVVVGRSSVNNPTAYTSLGIAEETDQALRLRRQKSVQQPSQGYFNALYAALSNVVGVTTALLYENDGGTTDSNGVPGHSIWAIVAGGSSSDVAKAIYYKRNAGCGMRGSVAFPITQADGSIFTVLFDRVVSQNVYVQFTATSIDGINTPNLAAIIEQLPTVFVPNVGQAVNINTLATAVQSIDPNTLVSNAGFSLAITGPFTSTLTPSFLYDQLTLLPQNIYALPVQISPSLPTVVHGTTQQFTAAGGTQTGQTWTLTVNNSGGSITSGGLYTAGATYPVVDTVQVQDSNGNIQMTSVSVV
jgi:hypothetical protein